MMNFKFSKAFLSFVFLFALSLLGSTKGYPSIPKTGEATKHIIEESDGMKSDCPLSRAHTKRVPSAANSNTQGIGSKAPSQKSS